MNFFNLIVRFVRAYPVLATIIAFPYGLVIAAGGIAYKMYTTDDPAALQAAEDREFNFLLRAEAHCEANDDIRYGAECLRTTQEYQQLGFERSIRASLKLDAEMREARPSVNMMMYRNVTSMKAPGLVDATQYGRAVGGEFPRELHEVDQLQPPSHKDATSRLNFLLCGALLGASSLSCLMLLLQVSSCRGRGGSSHKSGQH
jgi:hypothetical protein